MGAPLPQRRVPYLLRADVRNPRGHGNLRISLWILLAACVARLWLAQLPSSFWVDETVTAFVVQHPRDPSFAIAPQVQESIYYWLPRAARALWGVSEISYRVPSILMMAIALFVIARVAARLIHPRAAWFAVFACLGLRGINYHAADARPYALGICVSAAAVWFLIRWLDRARWIDAGIFVFFAALLWRVHLIYWPFYLVFAVYTAMRIRAGDTVITWRRASVVYSVLALALLPVLWTAFFILRDAGAHVITKVPDIREFEHEVRWNLVVICGGATWLIARALGWKSQSGPGEQMPLSRPAFGLIAGWWLCQPVSLFLFSHLTGNSVFVGRYVSIALPGIALAATAATAMWLPPKYWRRGALLLGIGVLIVMGRWETAWPRHEVSDWRGASQAEIRLATAPDTPVICVSPFIEARTPAWRPDYSLPGFLYSHLAFYPLKGKEYLFPFESRDGEKYAARLTQATLAPAGRFMIYGSDKKVDFWEDWFRRQPQLRDWRSRIEEFGDVSLAVFER